MNSSSDCLNIWQTAAGYLKLAMTREDYEDWIPPFAPVSLEGELMTLAVPSLFVESWLASYYPGLLEKSLEQAAGRPLKISFVQAELPAEEKTESSAVATDAVVPVVGNIGKPVRHSRRAASGTGRLLAKSSIQELNRAFTFDSFVTGDNNRFAQSACETVAANLGTRVNPLFIYSRTGMGKTHLLQAIAQRALQLTPDAKVLYVTCEDFMNQYIDAMTNKRFTDFHNLYRNLDLLLLDDVQFLGKTERFQDEVFNTFNSLYNAGKQIVMTSDCPPHEINGLESRLVSRFEAGLTAEILPPDLETRIAIIHKKQEAQEYKLDEEVVRYVAARLKSNVRRLEGGIFKLVSYASLNGQVIDIDQTESLLSQLFSEECDGNISVDDIQRVVAEHYGLSLADMTSKRRPANIAFARQVAMYFAKRLTKLSYPSIAGKFLRNHATIIHAVTTVEEKIQGNDDFRREMTQLENRLKN